jgi:hypothetical protein
MSASTWGCFLLCRLIGVHQIGALCRMAAPHPGRSRIGARRLSRNDGWCDGATSWRLSVVLRSLGRLPLRPAGAINAAET